MWLTNAKQTTVWKKLEDGTYIYENKNQSRESFSKQIIRLNKVIRTEYIKLSEQQRKDIDK